MVLGMTWLAAAKWAPPSGKISSQAEVMERTKLNDDFVDRCGSLRRLVRIFTLVLGALGTSNMAIAHTPHDGIRNLAVSPDYENDQTLYTIVLRRLQRSENGGRTWKRLENGLTRPKYGDMVISPRFADDATILLATMGYGIFRSTDRGDTWSSMEEPGGLADVRRLNWREQSSGESRAVAITESGEVHISNPIATTWRRVKGLGRAKGRETPVRDAAIVAPADGTTLAVVFMDGTVSLCTDADCSIGAGRRDVQFPTAEKFNAVAVTDDGAFFVFNSSSPRIWRVTAAGDVTPLAPLPETDLGPAGGVTWIETGGARNPTHLYASSSNAGPYVSIDGGKSWRVIARGLSKSSQAEEHNVPHFSEIFDGGASMFVAGFDGLFRSDDRGETWFQLEALNVRLPTAMDVGTSTNGEQSVWLTTFDSGVYQSVDSGQTWANLNLGLKLTHLWSISLAPDNVADGLVLTATNTAMFRRQTGAEAWDRRPLGCKAFQTEPSWFEIQLRRVSNKLGINMDSGDKCTNLFPSSITFMPDFAESGAILFGTRYDGIYRSRDSGVTWEQIWDADGGRIIAIKAAKDGNGRTTLFTSVLFKGLFRSVDGGESWQAVGPEAMAEAMTAFNTRTLPIVVSPDYSEDSTIYVGTPVGLFVSADNGENWTPPRDRGALPADAVVVAVAALKDAASGVPSKLLLVSVRGLGLFASRDDGETFAPVAPELMADSHLLRALVPSPDFETDRRVYGYSGEDLFMSADAGMSWTRIVRPARYEEARDPVIPKGDWEVLKGEAFSAGTAITSDEAGDRVELWFTGSGLSLVGAAAPDLGIAQIMIDGGEPVLIDQYAAEPSGQPVVRHVADLSLGAHHVVVEVSGRKNPRSKGTGILVDALEIADAR